VANDYPDIEPQLSTLANIFNNFGGNRSSELVELQDKDWVSTGMISELRKCSCYVRKQEIQKLLQKLSTSWEGSGRLEVWYQQITSLRMENQNHTLSLDGPLLGL